MADNPRQMLTLQQVADELGLSIQTVRKLAGARAFPVTRVSSRAVRVKREDLDRYVQRRTIRPVSDR